jgi:cell division protease FtsH
MSERLGPIYYEHRSEHPFLGQRIATDGGTSDATAHAIEEETRRLMTDAVKEATGAVVRHRATLDRLVVGLLEKETLEGAALEELLGPARGPAAGVAIVAAASGLR